MKQQQLLYLRLKVQSFAGSIEADKCGEDKPTGFTLPVACAENDRVSPSEIEGGTHWKPNSGAVAFFFLA